MDALSARALCKTFGDGAARQQVLDRVHLSLRCGQLALIMGPSGCGKTTLLSLLGCLMRPCSGSLAVFGREVGALSPSAHAEVRRRHMSFVFQHFNLFEAISALDNVALGYHLRGAGTLEARRRARALLAQLGLEAHGEKLPRQLSGGQKQRVAIARALASPGRILLADEPTGALDRESSLQAMTLLRLAADQGRAVVVVTHDPTLEGFADRVIELEDGRIVNDVILTPDLERCA